MGGGAPSGALLGCPLSLEWEHLCQVTLFLFHFISSS